MAKCPSCLGSGRHESVYYYYGVMECGLCDGTGVDPESLCPAECGRTYGDHLEAGEIPEDYNNKPINKKGYYDPDTRTDD